MRSVYFLFLAAFYVQMINAQSIGGLNPAEENRIELQKIASEQAARYGVERLLIDRAVEQGEVLDRLAIGANAETQLKSLSTGVPVYYITDNANAAISIGANKLHTGGGLGYTLNGQGMQIGEWDGATLVGHQEFGNRAIK